MLTAALPLPSLVAPVAPAPPDAAPAASDAEPGAFARELQAARGDDGADAEAAAGTPPTPDASRPPRDVAARDLRREAAARPSAPSGAAAGDSTRGGDPDAETADAILSTEPLDPQEPATSALPDASLLSAWLVPLRPAAPAPAGPGGPGSPTPRPGAIEGSAADAVRPLGTDATAEGLPRVGASDPSGTGGEAPSAASPDRGRAHALAARLPGVEGQPAEAPPGRARPVPGDGAVPERDPVALATSGPAPTRSPDAAPPAPAAGFAMELQRATQALAPDSAPTPARELQVPTPVASPEFVPRLSAEVAVLARDGVQEARLQLNPAELGPVAVRIVVEGDRAQVHLAVDHATTLQLLDQSLPTLAAALRDQGLTLSGGGVFQQPRQAPRDDPGAQAQPPWLRGRGEPETAAAEAAPLRRVSHRGGLDVYA